MRDPARIKRILDKINEVWQDSPDFRFGQLVHYLFGMTGLEEADIFFIEDDSFEWLIDQKISK